MEATIMILFVVGLGLAVFEVLFPGVVFGLIGLGCVIAAVVTAFATQPDATLGTVLVCVALVLLPALLVLWLKLFERYVAVKTTEAGSDSAEAGLKELLGREGVAVTKLRPAGMARIGDRRVDVVTSGEMIDADTRIKVIQVEGNRVVVRAARG